MLTTPNGIVHCSATQSLPFLGFVHNRPFAAQNPHFLRHRHKDSYCCHQRRLKPLQFNKGKSNDNDYLSSTVERLSTLFAAPTPGIVPDFALGYPFVLATAFLFLPISSAALLLIFFSAFSFAGRKLVLEDYLEEQKDVTTSDDDDEADVFDMPPTDLLALGSSILCTALVAPSTDNNGALLNFDEAPSVGVILILVSIVSTLLALGAVGEQTERASPDKQLVQLWDEQLAKESREQRQKKK